MKRIIWRLFGGITTLLILVVLLGWLGVRASLPKLDGEIGVSNLSNSATIRRDGQGIPTITATSRKDLAFATGFAHAQDRYFQMDLIRRQAAGELSEIVGRVALASDKYYRFHRFRARAATVLAAATNDERELLQRYADGVNAGLASLRARPFEYFALGVEPQPWRAEDSLLTVYAMFTQLNDSRASNEVRRGFAKRELPPEVYRWMYPDGSPWDAPLMGEPRAALPIPAAEVYSLRDRKILAPESSESGRIPLRGSNNWAVSGALTPSGRAIVSNDMHLGLKTPNIYYRARLLLEGVETRDLAGVTLPGAPFIIAGSNTQMAWGYTNSYGDYTDAVLLRSGVAENTYITPDGEKAFDVHVERIAVKGGDTIDYPVRETIWGPVLDDVDYPDGEIAVSWTGHMPESVNLNIMKLETAASVAEALDIANTMGMPPQNFVAGDAGGNIAWTIAGKIPTRAAFDATLPADWSAEHGWTGWVAAEDVPRIVNPESGRIWTANSRVSDGEALRIIGDGGYDLGARARQIRDGLYQRDSFSPSTMLEIQFDDRALFLTPWRDLLLQVLDDDAVAGDADLAEYRQLVVDWSPRADPADAGYRLVRAFRLAVRGSFFHALTAPVREAHGEDVPLRISNQFEAALWSAVTERPVHLLPANYSDWDDFLLSAVKRNVQYLKSNYDGALSRRVWGELNTAAIRHPLSRSIPLFGEYLNMPKDALNGDSDMPKVQAPSMGASERFSVAPGNEANGLMHMPTGQSGHPLSDFYDAGHSDWVNGVATPFLPGEALYTLTLTPLRR